MKLKILLVLLIMAFGAYAYLYFSYSRIYDFPGEKKLQPAFKTNSFTIGNSKGEGRVKYVALGDSLSAGVGSSSPQNTIVYSYAEHLAKKYWQVNVVNLSWPGDETVEVLKNQVPLAIAQKPDYITLFIGVNDIHEKRALDEFRSNYNDILNQLLVGTRAKITVINIPYLGSNTLIRFPFNKIFDMRTQQYNSIITSLAQNDRLRVVDLYTGSKKLLNSSSSNYSVDAFHPSEKGYLLWSKIINAD